MRRRGGDRDGFIVVVVLSVLALMASVIGALSLATRTVIDGAHTSSEALKLDALVQSGVELAAFQLCALKLPARRVTGQVVRFDGGTVQLTVEDEGGKVDLNGADPVLLREAYRVSGLRAIDPGAFAALVLDWRQRLNPKSAAQAKDAAGKPARPPRKEGFQSVEDLLWLPGIAPADLRTLAGYLTVHNPGGRISLLDAPDPVLVAIPGMTPDAIERIRRSRTAPPAKAKEALASISGSLQTFASQTAGRSFRVRIAAATEGTSRRTVTAVILRPIDKQSPYHIAEWKL